MPSRKIECIACGKIFYEGQGIRMNIAGREYSFHSKSCVLKFIKNLLLYLDPKDLENAVKLTEKEFIERLKELREQRRKNLEKI